jgi:NADH pyrophosphatase NudC (nudix superfamily)
MSKITQEAKARCAAHSMQEQLEQLRAIHAVEVAILNKRQSHDMHDVEHMLEGDMAIEPELLCWCTTCRPITLADMRFVVCPDCGNKRCPKAHNHKLACTNSNDVGQVGSSWEKDLSRVVLPIEGAD